MNLNQIKQEAREEFNEWREHIGTRAHEDENCMGTCKWKNTPDTFSFLEETLDRLLDAVEEAVEVELPALNHEMTDEDRAYNEGFNHHKHQVQEAFTNFKGEVTR